MSTTTTRKIDRLNAEIEQVQIAANKLITRLAERAAYASPEEYQEIRDLMAALKTLGTSDG